MATISEIEAAIRVADKAGRKKDVQALGAELQRLRAAGDAEAGSDYSIEPLMPASPQADFAMRPWYEKAGIATSDILGLMANGITLGGRDKFESWLTGDPEGVAQRTQNARDRSGFAGDTAEALGVTSIPLSFMPKLAEGTGAIKKTIARLLGASAEGGAIGGVDAGFHDRSISEGIRSGMVKGPLAYGAAKAGSKAVQGFAGLANSARNRLSKQDLPVITRTPTGRAGTTTPSGGFTFVDENKVADIAGRASKFDMWEKGVDRARRAKARSKGGSIDAQIRSQADAILNSPRGAAFNAAERQSLDKIVDPGGVQAFLSKMGNLAPTSNPMFAGMGGGIGATAGFAANSPALGLTLGLGLPAAGWLSKIAADRMTRNKAADFGDQIIAGKPVIPARNAVQDTAEIAEDPWAKMLRAMAILNQDQHKQR